MQDLHCRKLLRFVLRQGSQELPHYCPTKMKSVGKSIPYFDYQGLPLSEAAEALKEARIGLRRSPIFASRQQSAMLTIFASSLDRDFPDRSSRSPSTIASSRLTESSRRSFTRM